MSNIQDLENKINYKFTNIKILENALSHSSLIFFNKEINKEKTCTNHLKNERLEFLGDAILGMVIAEFLFINYPSKTEGQLSQIYSFLTSKDVLLLVANELDLQRYIKYMCNITDSILSDCVEAVIAAIYLDNKDIYIIKKWIIKFWLKHIDNCINSNAHIDYNPKSIVQEWAQKNKLPIPVYTYINKTGKDHEPIFNVELQVLGYPKIEAIGDSKNNAQKNAATKFISIYINKQ